MSEIFLGMIWHLHQPLVTGKVWSFVSLPPHFGEQSQWLEPCLKVVSHPKYGQGSIRPDLTHRLEREHVKYSIWGGQKRKQGQRRRPLWCQCWKLLARRCSKGAAVSLVRWPGCMGAG